MTRAGRLSSLCVTTALSVGLLRVHECVVSQACTSVEVARIEELNATSTAAFSGSICPHDSASGSSATAYCDDSACLTKERLSSDLPDCEYYGVNVRAVLSAGLADCTGGSTSPSSSGSATNSMATAVCSLSETQEIKNAVSKVQESVACATVSLNSTTSSSIETVCNGMRFDCLETLTELAADLPDCTLDGVNVKGFYQSVSGLCASSSLSGQDSSSNVGGNAQNETGPRIRSSSSSTGSSIRDTDNSAPTPSISAMGMFLALATPSVLLWVREM